MSEVDAALCSQRLIDRAVAQDDVGRAEREGLEDGRHHGEECIGVRSVGVEGNLAASVFVSVELADAGLLDRVPGGACSRAAAALNPLQFCGATALASY
ncbi:hypothetical protein [Streptomyces erythrochromogenes]|uniref:hypothetical protein n=1 Tax=Streptomyces erythrochromogenes TaxID=285574 RepID=UPI0038152BF6